MRLNLRHFCAILTLAASAPGAAAFDWRDPVAHQNRKANALAAEGRLDEALELYQKARDQAPDAPELNLNIGSALARMEEFEPALECFSRAISSDARLELDRQYNEGRLHLGQALTARQNGDLQSAIQALEKAVAANREALKRAPEQADARHNYEMALRLLKELQQQQQQQQQQDDQGESSPDTPQAQQQEQNEAPEPENQSSDSSASHSETPEEQSESPSAENRQQPQNNQERPRNSAMDDAPPEGLTPEQARRLLNQLGEEDPQTYQRLFAPEALSGPKWDNDW